MKRGYMDWDQALLPPQALEYRRATLARQLRREGLDAAVIYGDVNAADELIDFSNYGPYWCNTAAIITADGRYHLVTGHNARVNPWICQITGVDESQITPAGMKVPQRTAEVLRTLLPQGGSVGLVGKYTLADSAAALRAAGFSVTSIDRFTSGLLDARDDAYRAVVDKGHRLMEDALLRVLDGAAGGGSVKQLCAEIEYALRSAGAMDVVLLASARGLEFSFPREECPERWNLFVNVQFLGQWLVFGCPVGASRAGLDAALDAAAGQLRPGCAPQAAVEGFDIEVKTRVLSDHISSLNHSGAALAPGQMFSVSACDRTAGTYVEKMFRMDGDGPAALGKI